MYQLDRTFGHGSTFDEMVSTFGRKFSSNKTSMSFLKTKMMVKKEDRFSTLRGLAAWVCWMPCIWLVPLILVWRQSSSGGWRWAAGSQKVSNGQAWSVDRESQAQWPVRFRIPSLASDRPAAEPCSRHTSYSSSPQPAAHQSLGRSQVLSAVSHHSLIILSPRQVCRTLSNLFTQTPTLMTIQSSSCSSRHPSKTFFLDFLTCLIFLDSAASQVLLRSRTLPIFHKSIWRISLVLTKNNL